MVECPPVRAGEKWVRRNPRDENPRIRPAAGVAVNHIRKKDFLMRHGNAPGSCENHAISLRYLASSRGYEESKINGDVAVIAGRGSPGTAKTRRAAPALPRARPPRPRSTSRRGHRRPRPNRVA